MAISFGAIGTAANGTTSDAPSYPAGIGKYDLLLLCLADKYSAPTLPGGWTLAGQLQGGSGASGVDSGSPYATVYYKIADGTETGTETVTIGSGNSARGRILRYRGGYKSWDVAATTGASATPGTAWSATGAADPGIAGGDMVVCVSAVNSDNQTFSAEAITSTGITYGTATEREDTGTTNGDDLRLVISDHVVTSGTSSAAPVYTMTANGTSGSQPAGATVIVRIREAGTILPTATKLTSGSGTTGNITTSSQTPNANRVSLLVISQQYALTVSFVQPGVPSGCGLTWALLPTVGYKGQSYGGISANDLTVYTGVGASPTTGTVAVTLSSLHSFYSYVWYEMDAGASSSFASWLAGNNATTGGTTLSVTIGTLASGSASMAAFTADSSPITPRSGWTEQDEITTHTESDLEIQFQRLGEGTASGDSDGSSVPMVGIAWEITYPSGLATLAVTLGAVTSSSTATVAVAGTLAVTLGAVTSAATATVAVAATLTQTLGAVTVASAATNEDHASLAVTLDPVTVASTAVVGEAATAAVTLDPVTLSATATVALAAALDVTLGDVTVASTATVEGEAPPVIVAGGGGGGSWAPFMPDEALPVVVKHGRASIVVRTSCTARGHLRRVGAAVGVVAALATARGRRILHGAALLRVSPTLSASPTRRIPRSFAIRVTSGLASKAGRIVQRPAGATLATRSQLTLRARRTP